MTGSKISEIAAASNAEIVIKNKKTESKNSSKKEASVIKNWYEAKSPEGYTYYWHIGTGGKLLVWLSNYSPFSSSSFSSCVHTWQCVFVCPSVCQSLSLSVCVHLVANSGMKFDYI